MASASRASQSYESVSTASITNSTPPTSNEEARLGPSRAHFQKRYYEIKPLGKGANGETYLAIHKKVADQLRENIGEYFTRKDFFNALRNEIVVGKVPRKGRGTADDLTNEINFLARIIPADDDDADKRMPVSNLLQYDSDEDNPWLTMGLAKGRDLHDFIRRDRHDLTLGLRWHIGLQLAEAVAYLHHGITDLSSTDESQGTCWPLVLHGDLHSGNVLLTSSAEGSFNDYPDLLLADFGRAEHFVKPPLSPHHDTARANHAAVSELRYRRSFIQRQLNDIDSIGIILEGSVLAHHYGKLCPQPHCASYCGQCARADCERCLNIGKIVGKFNELGVEEKEFLDAARELRELRALTPETARCEAVAGLRKFAALARVQREKHYVLLSDSARVKLDAVTVSDEEIDAALGLGLGGQG